MRSGFPRWLFAVFFAFSGTALFIVFTAEVAPAHTPWLGTAPTHAEQHYGAWRPESSDWALPGWHRFWLRRDPPTPEGVVLVDRRHSRKQGLDKRLAQGEYRYNHMHGMGLLADALQKNGVDFEEIRKPLTGRRLAGASALFINLPSGDGPGFSHAEVLSIEAFVRQGGGLILLTDHSNAYFHGEMLQTLSSALGFSIPPVTACDKEPGETMSPKSTTWIVPRVEGDHLLLRGVSRLGLMTAGALYPRVDGPFEVLARTSDQGWQDHWNPYKKPKSAGFTGNMAQDPDEPDEAVPVLIAGQIGEGRVVVLADQNAWGGIMVGLEDNLQLALNAFQWAKEGVASWTADSPAVEIVSGENYACGTVSGKGFHTLMISAARRAGNSGRHACRALPGEEAQARIYLPDALPSLDALPSADRSLLLLDAGSEYAKDLSQALFSEEVWPQEKPFHYFVHESGQEVLVLRDALWLSNAFLGRERDNPRDADRKTQAAHRIADLVLGWAYGSP